MNLGDFFGFKKEEPVVTPLDNGMVRLDIKCVSCKETKSVTVQLSAYRRYKAGDYIQVAFPYHSANDRELMQSHMCAECFDGCTKEPEEDATDDDSTHEDDVRRSG
jgi:hypothetical protein